MNFQLKLEFIELDNLLKTMKLVSNGAEARHYILDCLIKVNGQVETRIRRKLRSGDTVEFKEHKINVVA